MLGAGIYGGVGGVASLTHSNCAPTSGVSSQDYIHAEANAGMGTSGGYSVDVGEASVSLSRSLKAEVGYGAMFGVGISTVTTMASPALW
jgi:hypothetical protein